MATILSFSYYPREYTCESQQIRITETVIRSRKVIYVPSPPPPFIYNAVTSKSHSRTNILILFNYINRGNVESGSENSTRQQINVPKVVYPRVVSGGGRKGGEQCRYESRVGLNSIVKHATRRSRFTIEMPRSYKFRASSLATLHTHPYM